MKRFHGKPFNYFKLGKSFHAGRDFMEHMKASALALVEKTAKLNAFIRVDSCPICKHPNHKHELTLHGFEHHRCLNEQCRHFFVSALIPDSIRNDFFTTDNGYSAKNYCDRAISDFRIAEIAGPKVDFVLKFAAQESSAWLDVGCGSGEILFAAKQKGWRETVGLELSHNDIDFAKSQYGIDVFCETLESYASRTDKRFDVISFFGVLHCVPNPSKLLDAALQLLKPGGVLAAELSHHDSVEYSALQTFPNNPTRASYNGATTLHHFTESSAQVLFKNAGLIPEAVWFYGTDIYEILNQWCFESPSFLDSPLYTNLLALASDLQAVLDSREMSSGTIWIARKAS